jgi:hypothetical protein
LNGAKATKAASPPGLKRLFPDFSIRSRVSGSANRLCPPRFQTGSSLSSPHFGCVHKLSCASALSPS